MDLNSIQLWIEANPLYALGAVILLSILAFLVARLIIARGMMAIAKRTRTQVDDIVLKALRPYRIAWLAPLLILYALGYLAGENQYWFEKAVLFLILWILALTLNALLNAVNTVYESSSSF